MKYTLALLLTVFCFASPRAALAQQLGGLAPFGRPAEANVPGDGLVLGVTTFESPTPQATGYFGESTVSVPDVNDDGIDDLVIGAPGERVGPLDSAGRVYVFSGADGSLLLDLVSPIPTGVGNFGRAVAGLPDLDGDGAGDLLIGAFLDGADRNGRAYVFSGAEGTLIRTLQSPSPDPNGNGYFGFAVAGVPDVSGDGVPDLLVGAFLADSELGDDAGRVYLFDGATGALRLGIGAGEPEGHFGFSVAGVPDADGDGLGDFLVGAVSSSGGRGQVTLYSGATGDFRRRFFSPNSVLDGGFGGSVAGVPDLDGDGRGDLLVGAFSENGGADGAGRAYVFSGDDGSLIRALASPDPQENGGFGTVAAVLDVDLDGVPDVLVGAEAEGRAYAFSGATGALLTALMPTVPASGFGVAVAGVADLDGDGRGDLLVGSRFEDAGAEDAGRAYLFNGEGDGTNVPPLAIDDEAVTAERLTVFIPVYRNDVDANGDALFVESLGSPAGGSVKPDGDGILYTPNQGFIGIDSFTYTVSDGLGGSDEATVTVTVNQFPENVLPFAAPNPQADDSFGIGVSSVPDVNADGIDDLLIGAADENGIETQGRAYLYDGATGDLLRTLASPDPQFGGGFGVSVAGVSDVNGDGAGDLLIGAPYESGFAGRAYLFSGATFALLRTFENPSPKTVGSLGFSVAAVPSADGDTVNDLLIGGAGDESYLFSGSNGQLLRTLESPELESGIFGFSVAGLSDIDGDGRGDVVVGDFGNVRAYLFSGGTGELLRTLQSPNPEENGSFFGFPVESIADVSGDGLDDILVGAFFEDGGAINAGRAYVFDGATGDVLRTLTSPSPEEGGWFGIGLSSVPDADGDRQEDILVGAWQETGENGRGGRAHLFSGTTGILLSTLESPVDEAGGLFGRTVAGVPDLDGDELGELFVGARGEEGGAQNAGRAYLFLSGQGGTAPPVAVDDAATTTEGTVVTIDVLANDTDADGDTLMIASVAIPVNGTAEAVQGQVRYTPNAGFIGTDSFTYIVSDGDGGTDEADVVVSVLEEIRNLTTLVSPTPQDDGVFGQTVSGVSDVDGDGVGDLLVGASREDGGAPEAGRAYVFSGATGALLRTLASPNPEDGGAFGVSVSGVSDVDGDGVGDLAVGAGGENGGAPEAGRAYVFSGATGALLRTLASPNPEDGGAFGLRVSGVSDVDGDGVGDLLVGAYLENGGASRAGRAYLFSGSTGALLHTLISPNPRDFGVFGQWISGVSDVDSDGVGDLLVGASREDGGAPEAGRAYVFSGATGTLLRTLASPNPEDGGAFGVSVSGVSDVDGDGVGDLAIGANMEDGGAMNAGRVYVFSGATGASLRTLASPNPGRSGLFGFRVSVMPDVDGDGVGDLAVGALREDGGAPEAGRVYVFSGATGALLRTLASPNPEDGGVFSYSVSGVSDVDGDGVGDLAIGAEMEDGGAMNAGRAYVFSGAVGSINQLPMAANDAATTTEGTVVTIDVLANDDDPDGDTLMIASVGSAMNGVAEPVQGQVRYTPNAGFIGEDSFMYTVSDGNGGTDDATVTVTVEGGSGGGFDVVPAEVAVTLNQGESRTVALTLTNTSAQDATWSFPTCETARRAHGVEPAHRGIHQHVELAKGQRDPRPGHAPRFGAGGPDGFGYRWIDSNEPGGPTFDFVDISETGTGLITISDTDDISEFVQLPFTFSFYGQDYDGVHVGTNGYLSFGQGFGTFSNDPIPSEETPNGFVAPFWDDLDPRTAEAAIYVQDLGDGRFVVQYDMIRDFPASSTEGTEKTFQVILYESGAVLFQYADMGEGLTDATVGVENLDGTDGLEIAFDEVYVENGLAVLITSQPQWITAIDPPCGTLAPNTSTDVVVTLDAAGIAAGTYTHDLVLTTDVIGSEQRTIPFTFTVTEASIVVETQEETASANGVPVTVDVIGFTPTVAELRYRPTGTTEYATTALALNGTAYEGSVPAGAVTLRGVEYYVLLSDGERTVTFPADDPEANPARVRVRVAQEASAVALPADAEYRMVSVPLVLDDPSPLAVFGDDFGDYGPTSWRLLRHRPLAEQYAEFPDLNADIVPGAGFWLAAYAEDTAPFDVEDGLSVDASEPFALTLPPGWSQIGNPFAFPVAWDAVLGSDLVQPPASFDRIDGDEPQYVLGQTVLDPWAGYFVLNDTEETVTLQVPPTEVGETFARGGEKEQDGYRLQLRADAREHDLRDTQNVLGFADGAAEGKDRRDLAEPPPITSHLRLSAVEDGVRLGHSFRPAGTDGAAWELELTASADVLAAGPLSVRVALDELGARPDGYDVHVLDLDREVPLTLLEGAFELTLRAERPVQRLRLIAGTAAYADAARQGISLVPVAFALAPAYPNPFAGSTTLAYELPEPADVVLEVYDLLGRRVAVLAEGAREAGRYAARWDGTVAGAPAANGVYVYRLRAGAFTASHKMVLLR